MRWSRQSNLSDIYIFFLVYQCFIINFFFSIKFMIDRFIYLHMCLFIYLFFTIINLYFFFHQIQDWQIYLFTCAYLFIYFLQSSSCNSIYLFIYLLYLFICFIYLFVAIAIIIMLQSRALTESVLSQCSGNHDHDLIIQFNPKLGC